MDVDTTSRKPIRPELKFSRFVRDALHDLTNLDSRIWLTVRGLARPGYLAREWVEGRGHRTLPPMRLYLIASALFFLVGANSWLMGQVSADISALVTEDRVSELNAHTLQDAVLHRVSNWAALLRMFTLLVIGMLLAALAPRNGPRLVPSLVLTMHFHAVSFFLIAITSMLLFFFSRFVLQEEILPTVAYGAVYAERLLMAGWMIVAVRTAHERSWLMAILLGTLVWSLDTLLLVTAFAGSLGLMEGLLSVD